MKNLKPKVCSVTIFMEPSFQSQSFGVIEIVITFEKKDIVGTNIENGMQSLNTMEVWQSIIFYIMAQVCTKSNNALYLQLGTRQLEPLFLLLIEKNIKLFLKVISPFQINLVVRFLFRAVCFFSPKISPDLPFMPGWHQVGIREDSQPLSVLGTVWSFSLASC